MSKLGLSVLEPVAGGVECGFGTMLLSSTIKSHFKRAVVQWCSTRLFCDNVEKQVVSSSNSVGKKLGEILGCSEEHANFLVRKNRKFLAVDSYHISEVAAFCKRNLTLENVLSNPTILSLSPDVLCDRMSTLKELGCPLISAGILLVFHDFMKMTPSKLRWKEYMSVVETTFPRLLVQLKFPDDLKLQLTSKLLDMYSKNIQLEEIKVAVNTIYLAWRLQCTEEVATDLIKKEPSLRTSSFYSLEQICEVLLKKFELPVSKVCSLPKLLTINCRNVEQLVQKVPDVCGVSIYDIINRDPIILKRPAESICDTAFTLEQHGVTDTQLLSCTRILRLRALTISLRLEKLSHVEKYNILKKSEKFLLFVVHFKNVSTMRKILGDLKIQCSVNTFLTTSETNAVVNHCRIKPPSRNSVSQKRDLISYLAVTFGDTAGAIKMELQNNPNFSIASVQNAKQVLRYLTSKGVSDKQLRNGLDIVLYDADVVAEYFTDLPNREDIYKQFTEWVKHPNLIQLLIYVIEKDHSFTSNGVYASPIDSELVCSEEDEILLAEDIDFNAELL